MIKKESKTRIGIKKLAKIGAIVAVSAGFLLASGCTAGLKQDVKDLNEDIAQLDADALVAKQDLEIAEAMAATLVQKNVDLANNEATLSTQLEKSKLELDAKDQELLAYETAVAEEEDLVELQLGGYAIDEVFLWEQVVEAISDREVVKLFDGEVEFDDEDYDVEEVYLLDGVTVVTNEEDMGSNTYLVLEEGSVSYGLQIDEKLDLSDVDEDETLTLSFLGEDVEISEWDEGEVTFTSGTEYGIHEGEELVIDNVVVKLVAAGDGWVYVKVGEESSKVYEGESEEVGGMEVYVEEVVESVEWRPGFAELKIGEDVSVTIEDGDEYAKDSVWEWVVEEHYLGLELVEDLVDADLDEEYPALAVGEMLSLPNTHLTVEYMGLDEVDYSDYSLELDMKGGNEYVEVKGKMTFGLDDYDRVYVDEDGFYDEDLELISEHGVGLDEPDMGLELSEGSLVIVRDEEVLVSTNLDLDVLEVDEDDLSNREEDYLSSYGVLVKSPEDNLEDNEVKLSIPEEKVEATLKVY